MNTHQEFKGHFSVFIRYDDEKKYRPFAEGCSLSIISDMCATACRLAQVKYIRIDEHDEVKPFKLFIL